MDWVIEGGRVLQADGTLIETRVGISAGRIAAGGGGRTIDARDLLVLPGIVDIHGDAFERQIMPRAGVHFALDTALRDTDLQMIANGITTAYHGITCSWEPGLRSRDNFIGLARAIHALRGELACDTRVHLRFETFNLDCLEEALSWLEHGLVELLAFNDHTPDVFHTRMIPKKVHKYVERTGLSEPAFCKLVEAVYSRAGEVEAGIERLARAARAAGVPMLSHDDETAASRDRFDALGCRVAEFPKNREAAARAVLLGNPVVMGAPNVVRGESHNGSVDATEMVEAGLCQILASDYYYPAPLQAAFRLAADGRLPLGAAWKLVSGNPAAAAGLKDRGQLTVGRRADLLLVDASEFRRPRVLATFVAGEPVYLGDVRLLADPAAHPRYLQARA